MGPFAARLPSATIGILHERAETHSGGRRHHKERRQHPDLPATRAATPTACNGNFPAARWKPGKPLPDALRRELQEELAIQADIGPEVFRLRHQYPDRYVEVAFFAVSTHFNGEVSNQVFEAVKWAHPLPNLPQYNFLEADRDLVDRLSRGELV